MRFDYHLFQALGKTSNLMQKFVRSGESSFRPGRLPLFFVLLVF